MLKLISGKNHCNRIPHLLHNGLTEIRCFRPLAKNIVMQQRRYLKQALLETLDCRRCQKEMQIAFTVERCHNLIERQINAFLLRENESIESYTSNLLGGKSKIKSCFFQEFLSPSAIDNLLDNIKHSIQLEMKKCFGAAYVDIAALQYIATDFEVINYMVNRVDEYRNTLLLAEIATEVGNQTWEHALGKLDLSPVLGKLLKRIKLGTIAMKSVGCDHKMLFEQCRRQLEQELVGILLNVTHKVKILTRNKATQIFYEMYDNTYGSYFMSLEHNIRTRAFRKAKQAKFITERIDQQAM